MKKLIISMLIYSIQINAQEVTPYVATSMGIGLNKQSVSNQLEAGVEIDAGNGYVVAALDYRANWLHVLRDGVGGKVGYRFNTDYEDRSFEKGWVLWVGYYKPMAYDKEDTGKAGLGYGIRRNHNGIAYTDFFFSNNRVFSITVGILFSRHSVKGSVF